ncbi:hypothetical protein HUN58_14635 [Curtobacterium sp. Csp1]|uniref:hypothetical protein n=1 Tax=Curtobacterium sp. Csp1 TaxID=2495429 RepID=UPI001598CAF5|nr:hypothetical protein [Curtobacterium sp. Csp1]QKS20990.1 hypothetical protein HUN58_14635 [Curtobacterium sp. Csp1]
MVNITDHRGNQFTVPDEVADDYRAPGIAVPAPADDPAPDEHTHNGDIRAWADRHDVDLGDATTKADMLDVIRASLDG